MATIKTHRDLDIWQLSMDFVVDLYRITNTFPSHEKYRLVQQIRCSAVSVCSNIAEGAARNHSGEFLQFLYIALGSVAEIETQMEIALRVGYLTSIDKENITLYRQRRMLKCLIEAIKEEKRDEENVTRKT